MASITSFISLFVLLATYSYSLPVVQQYSSSTPQNVFTSSQTTGVQGNSVGVRSFSDISVTNFGDVETTTSFVTRPPRGIIVFEGEEVSTPESTTVSEHSVRQFDDEVTTPESTTASKKRAFGQFDDEVTTPESTTVSKKRVVGQFDDEVTTPETTTASKKRAVGQFDDEVTTPETTTVSKKRVVGQFDDEVTTPETTTVSKKRAFGQFDDEVTTPESTTASKKRAVGQFGDEFTTPESTTVSKKRVFGQSDDEVTTPESTTLSKRSVGESDSSEENTTSDTVKFTPRSVVDGSDPVFTPTDGTQNFGQFSTPTIESSIQFNQRAINTFQSAVKVQDSTPLVPQHQNEVGQNIEPSSSVTSFAQSTGFLNNVQSATFESEHESHPWGSYGSSTVSPQSQGNEKRGVLEEEKTTKQTFSTTEQP
jgi:hypothetical protein